MNNVNTTLKKLLYISKKYPLKDYIKNNLLAVSILVVYGSNKYDILYYTYKFSYEKTCKNIFESNLDFLKKVEYSAICAKYVLYCKINDFNLTKAIRLAKDLIL